MVSLTPLLLLVFTTLCTSAATPDLTSSSNSIISKRATIAQVKQDVINIDTNVKALIIQTNAYKGGFIGATPQLAALTAVYVALASGDLNSGLLPPSISEADTNSLIQLVNTTLAIDNPIAIDALISKKQLFQDAHLDGFVVAAVKLLLAGHETFSANILKRIPASTVDGATEVVEVITRALQKGIHSFEAKNS